MKSKRILYFDLLNIISCIAVIFLHHNVVVHVYEQNPVWAQALVIEVICYWAVPVFLMLSGANLLNYREKYDTKIFLEKRVQRAVIPFLFWSVVYTSLVTYWGWYDAKSAGIRGVLNDIINCRIESIYWFFPTIFSIYALMPVLSKLTKGKDQSILWYIVGVLFVFSSLIPPLCSMVGIEWNTSIGMPINSLVLYVILGYLLANTEISREKRIALYILGLMAAVFRYGAVFKLSIVKGTKDELFFNYSYFPAVFLSVAVFLAFKYIDWSFLKPCANCIAAISNCSLGIYLLHKLVMPWEQKWLHLDNFSLKWRLLCPFVTYFVSLLIIAGIKKIPVLKKIVP